MLMPTTFTRSRSRRLRRTETGASAVEYGLLVAAIAAVIVLIAWRLGVGAMDKMRYGETTFILQYPVWWGYAFAMVGAVVAVIVSFYMLAVRIGEVVTGKAAFGPSQGGMH